MAEREDIGRPKNVEEIEAQLIARLKALSTEDLLDVAAATEENILYYRRRYTGEDFDFIFREAKGTVSVLQVKDPTANSATQDDRVTPAETDRASEKSASEQMTLNFAPVDPPGETLSRILSVVLTRNAYTKYVEPVIADMQFEYADALKKGHTRHARWIVIRGHLLIVPGWVYALVGGWLGWIAKHFST